MQRQFDKMKEVHVAEVSRGTLKIEAVMMTLLLRFGCKQALSVAGGGSVFCLMTLQQCLCLRMFALEAPTRVLKIEFKKLLANIAASQSKQQSSISRLVRRNKVSHTFHIY